MITYPPKEVSETLGERVAEGFKRWFDEAFKNVATRENIAQTNQAVAVLSKRVEHLEDSVDEIKSDIKDIRTGMQDIRTEMKDRDDRMNEQFDGMYHQTFTLIKWTVGLLGFFGTVISIMIFVGQFIKH